MSQDIRVEQLIEAWPLLLGDLYAEGVRRSGTMLGQMLHHTHDLIEALIDQHLATPTDAETGDLVERLQRKCPNTHEGDAITMSEAAAEILALQSRLGEAERLYHELLFAVSMKHDGETRHETALRYIRQAETGPSAESIAQQEGAASRFLNCQAGEKEGV